MEIDKFFLHKEQKHPIERIKTAIILGPQNKKIVNLPAYTTTLPELTTAINTSWAWHGTGRYHYKPNSHNKIKDVL